MAPWWLALSACGWFGTTEPTTNPPTGDASAPEASADAPRGPTPQIRVRAPDDGIPDRILVSALGAPWPDTAIGGPPTEGTKIRIEPEIAGTWTVESAVDLVFVPTSTFRPSTTYLVTVEQIVTDDGTFTPPAGTVGWQSTFTTPAFGLGRLSLRSHDTKAATAEVDLVFTGAVDPREVAKRVKFELGAKAVTPIAIEAGARPHLVTARFKGAPFDQGGTMYAAIDEGVPWTADPSVVGPKGIAQVDLVEGSPVDILAASLREGDDGFFVDVVCRDQSVRTTRYYWDRFAHEDYEVSSRCEIDPAELGRTVRFDPPLQGLSASVSAGGFRVFGDFTRGDVKLVIEAGARTVDGGVVQHAFDVELDVPARSPRIEFLSKGRYLPKDAWKRVPVTHRNIDAIAVQIRHVPPRNLVFWMEGNEDASPTTADLVVERSIPLTSTPDVTKTTWLDLGAFLPDPADGLYEVKLLGKRPKTDEEVATADLDTGWSPPPEEVDDGASVVVAKAAARIVVTDLQVIAKVAEPGPGMKRPEGVDLWVVSGADGRGVAGAEAKLVRASGTVLGSCRTMFDGGCTITTEQGGPDPSPATALIVTKGADLTYLRFADLELAAEADVWGDSFRASQAYHAAVWSDRGAYRPGETAHVAAAIRDGNTHLAPPADLPVVIHVFDPSGKEVRKIPVATNAAGVLSLDLPFGGFATTGRWIVSTRVADATIGSTEFLVDEFVPERMAVEATASLSDALATDPVGVEVAARWLFGGSAAGNEVELTCQATPLAFQPPGREGFSFGVPDARRTQDLGEHPKGALEDGPTRFDCPSLEATTGWRGPATLHVDAAVREGAGGRASHDKVEARIHPERFYLGLKAGDGQLHANKPTTVEGVVVDWAGKTAAASGPVKVEIFRLTHEYGYVWDEAQGTTAWRHHTRRVAVGPASMVTSTNGAFSQTFSAADSQSDHLVVAKSGNARTELMISCEGWWSWYGGEGRPSTTETPRPSDPTKLEVKAPETVRVGEAATATIEAPWPGRVLFTVETDEVVRREWLDVAAPGPVAFAFTLENFSPNVYVTALLIKNPGAEGGGAYLPARAFGVRNVTVEPTAFVADPKLTVPTEVRPNQKLTVGVDVGKIDGPTFVTVAAVDEGVLSLTDFATPDPKRAIFAKRRLGVKSFETVGWSVMLPPAADGLGGDGDEGGSDRVSPVKPVALWSGVVPVGADGKVNVSFDVPAFRGELRVMAVAVGPKKVGRAEAKVTVRDPLVLQTTAPRFLVADDVVRMPVQVTNLTGRDQTVAISIAASEIAGSVGRVAVGTAAGLAVTFPEGATRTITIPKGRTGTAVIAIAATRAPAAARLRITAKGGGEESWEEIDLPISPVAPEATLVHRIAVPAGRTDIKRLLDGWLPGSERTSLWVTPDPYAQAFSHLRHLVGYPHGCLEQTTSATRPMLFLGPQLEATDPDALNGVAIDAFVQAGLDRVLTMQRPSGAFGYWPGASEDHGWGTAYALHLLQDAKAGGFAVPTLPHEAAAAWLGRAVDAAGSPSEASLRRILAYQHYVLARAGKGRAAAAQRLLDASGFKTELRTEDQYLLAAAMFAAGDRRHEAALKKPPVYTIVSGRTNDASFYSDLRSRGLMLAVFADLFGADPAGRPLADLVASQLDKQSGWYATQELVWAVTGLAKWSGPPKGPLGSAKLIVDGKPVDPRGGGPAKDGTFTWSLSRATLSGEAVLDVTNRGSDVWLVETTSGTRKGFDLPVGGQGLVVSRSLLDASGEPASRQVALGDTLFERITVTNTSGAWQENVAVVDRLPAGLEIENPRLGQGSLPPEWYDPSDAWSVQHLDLRDDRVSFYGHLSSGQSATVLVQVRAVSAGRFLQPELSAELMYDPSIWARARGEPLVVTGLEP